MSLVARNRTYVVEYRIEELKRALAVVGWEAELRWRMEEVGFSVFQEMLQHSDEGGRFLSCTFIMGAQPASGDIYEA